MKKRMLRSMLLACMLVIMLLPTAAFAEEDDTGDGTEIMPAAETTYPTCCSCGAATCALSGQSGHALITFDTQFPSGDSVELKSGNYYLGDDVNPSSVETKYNSNSRTTVNLYLNGKTLTMNSADGLKVRGNSTLNIYDNSANEGVITNIYYDSGDGVKFYEASSTATLYGGNISDCTGTGVYIYRSNTSFTMEGGTISNNGENGVYVSSSSTFTMNAGTISGNDLRGVSNEGGASTMKAGTIIRDNNSGGVNISGGTFTMEGGTICNNMAKREGGGVYIRGGTFIMEDGTISGNKAKDHGGGVYIYDGTFTMKRGTITGNTSNRDNAPCNDVEKQGGGVCFDGGTFNLSGGIITGNYRGSADGETVNNVYIDNDPSTVINVVHSTLSAGTKIGVTSEKKPTLDRPVVAITSNCSDDYSKHFFSDDAAKYHIENGGSNKVVLATGATTYTVTWVVDGEETIKKYEHGVIPSFEGSTDKEATAQYTYVFNGWDSEIVPVDGDKTYTATYTSIPKQYAVSVNASEGGTVSGDGNYDYNASVTITAIPDEGYEVESITVTKVSDDTTVPVSDDGTFIMPDCPVTVSVTFSSTIPDTYTVTYLPGANGTGDEVTDTKTEGINLTLKGAIFTRTGYTQTGWATSDGDTKAYDLNETYSFDAVVTLYPFWTVNTYTVTLNTDGATINSGNVTSYTYGVGAPLPTEGDMTKASHRFDGWYEDSAFSGSPVTTISTTATGNKTYYAKWTEVHTASGTVTGSDGTTYTGAPTVVLIAPGGETFQPTLDGNGPWTYSATVPAGQYNLVVTATESGDGGKTVTVTSLVDLTAQDTSRDLALPVSIKNSTVKISGDETPKVIAGGVDEIAANTDVPADASTITIELTVDKKAENAVVDDAAKIESVAGGQTIDLYLDIQLHLLKDDETTGTDLGSTNTQILELVIPADTSKTGLTVYRVHNGVPEAMKKDSADASGEYFTIGNGFITIYAKKFSVYAIGYTPEDTYTIILDANGGTVNGGSTATLVTGTDKKLSGLPTPTRSGYTFDGWFDAASGGTRVTTETVFAADYQRIYAQWTANSGGHTPPSSGGGGYYTPTYAITVEEAENGTVKSDHTSASYGSTVTLTVTPDTGYTLETLSVTAGSGKEIEVTNMGDSKYTFKMPDGKVTVKATFMDDNTMLNFFVDVPAGAYYYDAVLWAVQAGITNGTSATTFSPDNPCTRAQMATFLWRAAGSPDPVGSTNPFTDVNTDAYYAKAVQWAYEQGITGGTSATTFSPDNTCTRGQMATFLWRNAGSPNPVGGFNPFTDVSANAYYAKAVQWAYEQSITGGTSATTFSTDADCTRAQMVTFLYRYYVK